MRIPRIYCPLAEHAPSTLVLDKTAAHYLTQVLRLKIQDRIILFNGNVDGYFDASIATCSKTALTVQIEHYHSTHTQSPLRIYLGQAVTRPERMEYAIQKAVEIGVTHITLLDTEYCDGKNLKQLKLDRLQKIIQASGEQCERNILPVIHGPCSKAMWYNMLAATVETAPFKLVFHPGDYPGMRSYQVPPPTAVAIAVGPEGGFSEPEITEFVAQGFHVASLGPRILRNETATVAALTIAQLLWGDF